MERHLAAILAADMVGYSKLMAADEPGTIRRQKDHYAALIDPKVSQYGGRIVKTTGDGILAEFPSVIAAVLSAVEIQHAMQVREARFAEAQRIRYRIGINLGDIVRDGEDILGDGVNIAARLEGLAEPGGICVSRSVHTQVAGKLDLEFENLGEKTVKNLDKPVQVYRVVLDEKATALTTPVPSARLRPKKKPGLLRTAAAFLTILALLLGGAYYWKTQAPDFPPAEVEAMHFPLPDKPSIAVLPFANLGGDPEQEYFADGITNDLITDLSKFNSLFVIAANSTFTYKGKPVKVQQVAEDLGVRYVLEGSVQRTGDSIRINAQLIDALTGHHLWAERYERQATDLFSIQNEILKTIIGTLQLKVTNAETERALKRPTENLSAYDYYQRGIHYFLAWGKENNDKARAMQQRAIELDPDYARAYAALANLYVTDWRYEWAEDTTASLDLALQNSRKAVALDPNDYWNIWGLGIVYLARGESDLALAAYNQALVLNPNDPTLLMEMVELLVSLGDAEQAVAQAKDAIRYNPLYPDWYLWNLGWAQYMAGQHEEAVATLEKMTNPPNGVRRTLAPALVQVGRLDEARAMIKEYMKNEPEQTVADIRKLKYKHRAYVDKWANDLLKAGLPE